MVRIPQPPNGYLTIKEPEWIEKYEYWNNVDPPEEITCNQWEARGKKWEEILETPRILANFIDAKEIYSCKDVMKIEESILGNVEWMSLFKAQDMVDDFEAKIQEKRISK